MCCNCRARVKDRHDDASRSTAYAVRATAMPACRCVASFFCSTRLWARPKMWWWVPRWLWICRRNSEKPAVRASDHLKQKLRAPSDLANALGVLALFMAQSQHIGQAATWPRTPAPPPCSQGLHCRSPALRRCPGPPGAPASPQAPGRSRAMPGAGGAVLVGLICLLVRRNWGWGVLHALLLPPTSPTRWAMPLRAFRLPGPRQLRAARSF
jgi:hypothetical protein